MNNLGQNITKKTFFTSTLLAWYRQHQRPLPWKGINDPYLIWLSEIILQQTRVAQGLPYFERFRDAFPTVTALADAPQDDIMKLWEGLGYYSRAANLHTAAKYIAYELKGVFPSTYETILQLKGVGPYTAAAIASFAFGLPQAVVDGNVYRVLSRYFGIDKPIDTGEGKKYFALLAQELLAKKVPADYNQAIMDFGATHCTPKNTKCSSCSFQKNCVAFAEKKVDKYPVKSKKLQRKTRFFTYFIIHQNEKLWIQKRTAEDIWKNLYQFPMIESEKVLEKEKIRTHLAQLQLSSTTTYISSPLRQVLTHQTIITTFVEVETDGKFDINNPAYIKISRQELRKYAFPKIINEYLNTKKTNQYTLPL